MGETSDAVHSAVMAWLENNRDSVLETFQKSSDAGIEMVAVGIMSKVGAFLDNNRQDIISAIATAIATSSYNRHPQQEAPPPVEGD